MKCGPGPVDKQTLGTEQQHKSEQGEQHRPRENRYQPSTRVHASTIQAVAAECQQTKQEDNTATTLARPLESVAATTGTITTNQPAGVDVIKSLIAAAVQCLLILMTSCLHQSVPRLHGSAVACRTASASLTA
jgi:hypothetical protein